jgi:hypothetical protein
MHSNLSIYQEGSNAYYVEVNIGSLQTKQLMQYFGFWMKFYFYPITNKLI